uniref:Uncharacterized protein n=1 Tax=Picea glauca TaxID=3330 RepID=A0A101LWZ4_PICGL|nr:hypothetical protein ABT39_MTgene6331 [Picea glauca]QHR87036.1 hypothetical protein Q903MT_gene1045 [Picea sitchensis]
MYILLAFFDSLTIRYYLYPSFRPPCHSLATASLMNEQRSLYTFDSSSEGKALAYLFYLLQLQPTRFTG